MRILIIDDESELLEILAYYIRKISSYEVLEYDHWNKCDPVPGDIIIHDIHGIGNKKEVKGVKYLTMSGDNDHNPDLPKPFKLEDIKKILLQG